MFSRFPPCTLATLLHMSNSLTPQKRKLQLSGDSCELESTESSEFSSQTSNELVLSQSPSDSTGLTLFKTSSPLRLSQTSSPTRSSRTARIIHATAILQQQNQPSSPQIPTMAPLQISQLYRLFNQRPAPFPLELLKAPILADIFLKGRALERYLQRRFDEIKQSQTKLDTNGLRPLQRPFVRSSPPSVPFSVYLERLFRYCHPEPLHLLSIVAYSERLIKEHGKYVPPSGWHRFIVAAWIISGKAMLGDQYWTNLYWARVAGISVLEICSLESELVFLLNWRLQIPLEELNAAWYLVQL